MPDIYKQTTIEEVILTAFAVIIILLFLGCLYSFFRGIFFFIFGGGKEDNKKKGRNSIRFMIIGLIISVGLLIVFPYAIKSAGIQTKEDYNAKKVFAKAGELFKKVFELGQIIKAGQKENEFRGNLYYDINGNISNPSTSTSTYDL